MNQLSWLIYLADVAQSAEGWLNFFGWATAIIGTLGLVVWVIVNMAYTETDRYDRPLDADGVAKAQKDRKEMNKVTGKLMSIFMPLAFLTIMMSIFIPSKDTFYAIAASELGEAVATADIGQKAGLAIEAWLDKQINETRAAAADAVQPAASTPAT